MGAAGRRVQGPADRNSSARHDGRHEHAKVWLDWLSDRTSSGLSCFDAMNVIQSHRRPCPHAKLRHVWWVVSRPHEAEQLLIGQAAPVEGPGHAGKDERSRWPFVDPHATRSAAAPSPSKHRMPQACGARLHLVPVDTQWPSTARRVGRAKTIVPSVSALPASRLGSTPTPRAPTTPRPRPSPRTTKAGLAGSIRSLGQALSATNRCVCLLQRGEGNSRSALLSVVRRSFLAVGEPRRITSQLCASRPRPPRCSPPWSHRQCSCRVHRHQQ